jgi:molecular chaperone DnaJ
LLAGKLTAQRRHAGWIMFTAMATMPTKRDYYEVLGLERSATHKEIAEAYRKLALQHHPDRNPNSDDAVGKFKEAAEAFEVLGDEEKRSRYDRYGHAGVEGGVHQFTDVNDILEAFGDIFGGGVFGDLFGGGRRGGRRPRKGEDVACELKIDLFEAARGVTKTIEFDRHEPCTECRGTGAKAGTKPETCRYCGGRGQVVQASGIFRVQTTCPACQGSGQLIKDPCSKCHGSAYVVKHVFREVKVPAGVDHHMRVRLAGEGEPSTNGGPPGDCFCVIILEKHPLFERDGHDLICQIPISYAQAALGAKIEVPTLDGPEDFDIPSGTQPNQVFKLRRRGMPDPRGGGKGDLLIVMNLEVPKSLSAKQEKLLRDMAIEEKTNVSPRRTSFLEKLKDYFVPAVEEPRKEKKRG